VFDKKGYYVLKILYMICIFYIFIFCNCFIKPTFGFMNRLEDITENASKYVYLYLCIKYIINIEGLRLTPSPQCISNFPLLQCSIKSATLCISCKILYLRVSSNFSCNMDFILYVNGSYSWSSFDISMI